MTTETTAKAVSKREAFYDTALIVLVTSNPKKRGSMSYDRFEAYFTLDSTQPQTVRSALKAGVRMDDIRHDSEHGFIALGADIEKHKEAQEKARLKAIEDAKALIAQVEAEAKAEAKKPKVEA